MISCASYSLALICTINSPSVIGGCNDRELAQNATEFAIEIDDDQSRRSWVASMYRNKIDVTRYAIGMSTRE